MFMSAGRPSKFKPEFNEQVEKLCKLGATDDQIADFFNVTKQTVNNWKKDYPEFFDSIKKAKIEADNEIAKSLFHRAKGYTHDDIVITNYQGNITMTPVIKNYPPDTTAAIFWLKNRQPSMWRDKQEVEHSSKEPTGFKIKIIE